MKAVDYTPFALINPATGKITYFGDHTKEQKQRIEDIAHGTHLSYKKEHWSFFRWLIECMGTWGK